MLYIHFVKAMDAPNVFSLNIFSLNCGYGVDWSQIESQERWIQANIEGFYGHLDGLVQIFNECIVIPQ